jgi:ATP-dependent Clp protease ATP-binding subunit ClpA
VRHRFDVDTLNAATREALLQGSATVEAEHLLCALAASPDTPGGRLLAEAGLSRDGVLAALERETEQSLAAVGVRLGDFAPAEHTPSSRPPALATSAKRALEHAAEFLVARGDREITGTDLLVGILRAELGTVPRALAAAGVDRERLLARAEQLAGADPPGAT